MVKNILIVLLCLLVLSAVAAPQDQPPETFPIPKDLTVWGGLSLALIFNRAIVPLLYFLGLVKDDNKKLIGVILLGLGAAAGAIYSLMTLKIDEPLAILTNIVAGALSGILAVGQHSTFKNAMQHFKKE